MGKSKQAIDYAFNHGLLMYQQEGSLNHAPITYKPSLFPKTHFQQAQLLAGDFNQLMVKVANNADLMQDILHTVDDAFTQHLFKLYQQVYINSTATQALAGNLFRADYLLHQQDDKTFLRQVEINTIASAFVAFSSQVSRLHQFIHPQKNLLKNNALKNMVKGLARAWQAYGRKQAVIGFVVQAGEKNIFDQQQLAYALFFNHGIRVKRFTLEQLHHAQIKNQRLFFQGEEIAVAYFRAGYTPNDYQHHNSWSARLLLERCSAIKVPTLAFQLAGMKKVQNALASPPLLKQLISDKKQRQRIQGCFAQFYDLASADLRQHACHYPQLYVLKPQREGGGNNLYGTELAEQLKTLSKKQRSAWILMQRIQSPVQNNRLIQQQKTTKKLPVINELGIFSACLSQGQQIQHQTKTGHLLRTKVAHHNEGGISAGFAVLDSPELSEKG